jgi:hypothetical protein
MRLSTLALIGWFALSIGANHARARDARVALEAGFRAPPASARPRVWWHWMNGNVTREGITRDLEAMKRVGIAGVQIFTADLDTPVDVPKPIVYMSPEWLDMIKFAAEECERLDLEMTIHSAAGWSETGGTWVNPEDGMQRLVWSEATIDGPRRYDERLPSPPSVFGPFQSLSAARMGKLPPSPGAERFLYRDVAVLAAPVPGAEADAVPAPTLTSAAPGFDARAVSDGDGNTRRELRFASGGDRSVVVRLDYAQPVTIRSWTTWTLGEQQPAALEASDDGRRYRAIARSTPESYWSAPTEKTVSFAPVTARHFRVVFTPRDPKQQTFELAELRLSPRARVNRFEDKALFSMVHDYPSIQTTDGDGAHAVAPDRVTDLSSYLDGDGRLHWDVPPGRWRVWRLGHAPTGQQNGPAPKEARGLEVDKLDARAVEAYFDGFVPAIQRSLGPLFGSRLQYVLMDSWEASHQNWTPRFADEFARRRGYDPRPYLPVMTGQIIGSPAVSDRFLEDVRRTLADLVADHHYRKFADLLHARGLRLYAESIGIHQPMVTDELTVRGIPDVPMGEFWVRLKEPIEQEEDCKLTASAAHIYGKPIAAAEAFTTDGGKPSFGVSPFMMKRVGDLNFAAGINRFVIHEYAHQPTDARKPGFTLGPFGLMFNRQITWWEQSAAWLDYLARTSFLLQQGSFRADVLYYYGESVPVTVPARKNIRPAVADGYDYDFVNADVLTSRLRVGPGGELQLPDGPRYRLLVLTSREHSPRVLERVRELVLAGATVVGERPRRAVGLAGYPASDEAIGRLASELWGACDGTKACDHHVGTRGGRVVTGRSVADVLRELRVDEDVRVSAPADARVAWIHRATADADLYFLSNQSASAAEWQVDLRVVGRAPELWHPDTGGIEPAARWRVEGTHTRVTLPMDAAGSVFVVFRRAGSPPRASVAPPRPAQAVPGPWRVSFTGVAAPQATIVTTLASWTESPDASLRFFSGTGTYKTTFQLERGGSTTLDLGQVHEFADVSVDGKRFATLWKPPYRVDLGRLAPGRHELEVRVTNLWPNRLIGDAALPPERRSTWTTHNTLTKDSALTPSGLLGPVTVQQRRSQPLLGQSP